MEFDIAKQYEEETGAPFTDALTGLFNHGFFKIQLDREIIRASRYNEHFTVSLIDIHRFDLYNKKHGPLQGDRLLRDIADIIRKNIRKVDFSARYSGDQFAVIMAKSGIEGAVTISERIVEAIMQRFNETITVNIGLANYPSDAASGPALIAKISDALLHAKLKGKNVIHFVERHEVSTDDQESPTVLIVDDDTRNLKLLEAFLHPIKCNVLKAENGHDALGIIKRINVDLILCDVMMPEMDGYEVCRRIKGNEATRLIPFVLVTALDDMEAKLKGIEAGADDFLTKPPNRMELLARAKSLINIKRLNDNLTSIEFVLFSMANAVEEKDHYTQDHVKRVSNMAMTIGKRMGLKENDMRALKIGGALHDIGKIGVPNQILNKPGPLNDEEWKIMKKHPEKGYQICLPLKKSLGAALDIIHQHHEKLDGSGYPNGLKENEISMVARIMAVADIYDALITDRPYRAAMSKQKAASILKDEAHNHKLDINVVQSLLEIVNDSNKIE